MPKRKVSADGAAKSAKPAPAKVDAKPKKAAGKDKSSDKKCKQKGRGEQRANKLKWLTSKLQICPQKTERLKTRVQPLK
ncbi:Non-histone chromosomal protein HMG-14 [Lemmus lemmus]